ncbi:MAG: hypothetical protein ACYSR5_11380 [Planctomycetota bacterium]|jgi:septal ring factor EnvC (AmiA/AmiB activator)
MDLATWATLVTALAGLVSAIVVGWKARKSAKKDDLDILRGIIDELQEKSQSLQDRVTELETENAYLKSDRDTLRERMIELAQENERLHRHIGELREKLEAYHKQANGL